ncbi:MAG: hypothetical protein LBF50_10395, partial [Azoarcus sp.]|nr:hypothetical protein [Azoarcus sp.]
MIFPICPEPFTRGIPTMKHSLLTAALLALAISACDQKGESSSPAPDVPSEQPAAPVSETPVDSAPATEAGNVPAEPSSPE